MSSWVRYAFVGFLWASLALSLPPTPSQCAKDLLLVYNPELLSARLDDVPGLRDQILLIMAAPEVPAQVRRVIRDAMEAEDTHVIQLTDAIRAALALRPSTHSLHVRGGIVWPILIVGRSNTAPTLNQQITRDAGNQMDTNAAPFVPPPGHTVLVPDRPLSKTDNDLLALIHELAHIRYDHFLRRNIDRLVGRFPDSLVRRMADGTYQIDDQLATYLAERYAWETQWSALKALQGRHIHDGDPRFKIPLDTPDEKVRGILSDHIARIYVITDPRILAFRTTPISQIFHRGITDPPPPAALPITVRFSGNYSLTGTTGAAKARIFERLTGQQVELRIAGQPISGLVESVDTSSGRVSVMTPQGRAAFALSSIQSYRLGSLVPPSP